VGGGPSEEQEEFRATLRRFFEEHSAEAEVRRLMDTTLGYDPATWKLMTDELGLPGLAIDAVHGGQGFGPLELGLALGEMGRSLLCAPFFSTAVLAASAVAHVGDEAARNELLPALATGEIAALAWVEAPNDWRPEASRCTAHADGEGFRLRGAKHFVIDGCAAARLLVVAREPGSEGDTGLGLFAVDADAPGVKRIPLRGFDSTRKLARIELDDARGRAIGAPGQAAPGLRHALDASVAALCAEMVGGMERCLENAVDYAGTRHQFGRPIGSFQAIKHKCADVLILLEGARSATRAALEAAAEDDPELPLLSSVAKAHCSEAYFRAATENIQILGGVGVTWEYDAHLYYRRAKSSEILLGDAAWHHEHIAREIGDTDSERH